MMTNSHPIDDIIRKLKEMNAEISPEYAEHMEDQHREAELVITIGAFLENVPDAILDTAVRNPIVAAAHMLSQFAMMDDSAQGLSEAVLLAYYAGYRDASIDGSHLATELFKAREEGVGE